MAVDVVRAVLGSSSTTKMAISFQKRLRLAASTILPSARSLLPTQASGVYLPGAVPTVWFSPSDMIVNRGSTPRLFGGVEIGDPALGTGPDRGRPARCRGSLPARCWPLRHNT